MSELKMRGYAVLLERADRNHGGTAISDWSVVQRPVAQPRGRDVLPHPGGE